MTSPIYGQCYFCHHPFTNDEISEERHISENSHYKLVELCIPCYISLFCYACGEYIPDTEKSYRYTTERYTEAVLCEHCKNYGKE